MTNLKNKKQYSKTRELRRGWTTGACATAASKAAYIGLLTGKVPVEIEILLPGGQRPKFEIIQSQITRNASIAAVRKDAGDDPDVTHGAIIKSKITRSQELTFVAGKGVGVVTKPGLPIEVGEPAINPEPRKMIKKNLQGIANDHHTDLNVEIEISVVGGNKLAAKTWNPRMGIIGGISILGTTGIVIPYSCAAWIASIHRGIDVARAIGATHVAACTGKTSEKSVISLYKFEPTQILDMGDFVGGTLKYLRKHPIPKLTIASGFGKLSKLAAGNMDLHSKRSQVDPLYLAKLASQDGVNRQTCDKIARAESAGNIISIIEKYSLFLGDRVAQEARKVALKEANNKFDIEVIAYNRKGKTIGHAPFSGDLN